MTAAPRVQTARRLDGVWIMEIRDTMQVLTKIRQSIDLWVPRGTARPDALIAYLNDVYGASTQSGSLEELFTYDDVGSPSLTLRVDLEAEFDLPKVMTNLRTKLRLPRPGRADEIGKAGLVWSHGRYDFVYDSGSGSLQISHQYSHQHADTKSVSSIAKQMIAHALDYLEQAQAAVTG
jgi:hypothetical protein